MKKLPQSWNTNQDGSGLPALKRRLRKVLGVDGAVLAFDTEKQGGGSVTRWYLVRFLDGLSESPERDGMNPSKRSFEVLGAGDSLNEIEWWLNRIATGGRVTAYVPVLHTKRGMVGLVAKGTAIATTPDAALPPSPGALD